VIAAAAVRTADGAVWSAPRPGRHDHVLDAIAASVGYTINSDDDPEAERRWWALMRPHAMGFVTDEGVFLERIPAMKHAVTCGQTFICHGCRPHKEHEAGKCQGFAVQHDRCQCEAGLQFERGPGLASEDLW